MKPKLKRKVPTTFSSQKKLVILVPSRLLKPNRLDPVNFSKKISIMIMKIINNQNLKILSKISFLLNSKGIAGNKIKNFKKNKDLKIPS